MTLVQNLGINGQLIIMTSDTRKAINVFGRNVPLPEGRLNGSKIGRISPYCVFGGGGTDSVYRNIQKELVKSGAKYLIDFFLPFTKAVEKMKKSRMYREDMLEEGGSQLTLMGFNSDNSTGTITYITGAGQNVNYSHFSPVGLHHIIISPSDEETEVVYKNVKLERTGGPETLLSDLISFAARIQVGFHLNDANTVSDTFVYCAMELDDDGEIKCYEGVSKMGEE